MLDCQCNQCLKARIVMLEHKIQELRSITCRVYSPSPVGDWIGYQIACKCNKCVRIRQLERENAELRTLCEVYKDLLRQSESVRQICMDQLRQSA